MVSMSIGGIAHANREHVSTIHNGCVTYNFLVTSKQKDTVGKNGTIWRSVPYLPGRRDNSLKNGTSGHPSLYTGRSKGHCTI
jgi:hypothetical protein